MIELRGVSKEYAGRGQATLAVDDVSLDLPRGQTLCLIGTSGCGKSTTLKMINRLIEPTRGEVRVDGRDVRGLDPITLRRSIGYVIQQVGLFPHLTVADNIALVARLERWDARRAQARVHELMDLVGLPLDLAGRHPSELSGGQQQRVGVSRALMLDPACLLMDEPFGALDPITRTGVQEEFSRLQREMRKTVVLVTHDLAEAIKLGSLIGLMDKGRLVQLGPPVELLARPATPFVAAFFRAHLAAAPLDSLPVTRVLDPAVRIANGDRSDGLLVDADGRFRALVTGGAARTVPQLSHSLSVREALHHLLESGESVLPVVDDQGRALGAISRNSVMGAI